MTPLTQTSNLAETSSITNSPTSVTITNTRATVLPSELIIHTTSRTRGVRAMCPIHHRKKSAQAGPPPEQLLLSYVRTNLVIPLQFAPYIKIWYTLIPFRQPTAQGTIGSCVISTECHIPKHHRPTTVEYNMLSSPQSLAACHHQPALLLSQNLVSPAASNKHDMQQWTSVKGNKMGGTLRWHMRWRIHRKFQFNRPLAKVLAQLEG
jgi:hypothetical protein